MNYIATFHTFFGAQCFYRRLLELGDQHAKMIPAPRALSVSCGTGIFFTLPFDKDKMADEDTECVFIDRDGAYECIFDNS